MRVAIDPDDRGHAEYLKQRPVLVFLDGKKVEHCTMADDELGEVEVMRQDEEGRLIIKGGELLREIKRGQVQIVPFGGHGL